MPRTKILIDAPRKDRERETRRAIVKDADKTEGKTAISCTAMAAHSGWESPKVCVTTTDDERTGDHQQGDWKWRTGSKAKSSSSQARLQE